MFKNRLLKHSYLLVLLVCLIPFGHIYGYSDQVKDIKGHSAELEIQEWLEKGLITGYPDHTFRPENSISRAEFVALVNRVFQFSDKSTIQFKDIKQTNWAYIEVQKAISQGYISGFEDNTFRPEKPINKQETAIILARILKLNDDGANEISVKDSKNIPSWSKSAIGNMLNKGIMSSDSDGSFQPQRAMTRAETVVALKKALASNVIVYDKAGVYGDTTVSTVRSDVIVQSSNVTLKNMHILGNLIISKEVGDGDFYLDKVQVEGVAHIQGGGSNSVHIRDSRLGVMTVNRTDKPVRIVAEGTSTIQDTQIVSSALIEENNITGDGFVNVSVLPESKESKARNISITGDFNTINVNGNVNELTIRSGKINSLFIKENLIIPSIVLSKGVIVQQLELKSKSTISGEGRINGIILSEDAKGSVVPNEQANNNSPTGGGGGTGSGGGSPGPGGGGTPSPGNGGGNPEPGNPDAEVTKIVAVNGSIEVHYNKTLTAPPTASDFKVLQQIDDKAFEQVEVSLVELLDDKSTVRLIVPAIGSSDIDQKILYSVSYKRAAAILSEVVSVPKSITTVTGTLLHLAYNETTPRPIPNMPVHLLGDSGSYRVRANANGGFTFENVVPGNYKIGVSFNDQGYYTEQFNVGNGQKITVPDLIIKQRAPVVTVIDKMYSDVGYIDGTVWYLQQPFSVKIERENGDVLKTPPGKFDTFFSFNVLTYNPGLVLNDNDKLYVTLYTDTGWSSERYEVKVVERVQTEKPVVTSVVYDDTKIVRGLVGDGDSDITITRADGTVIGRSYRNYTEFYVYLYENQPLAAGEKLIVYAQAANKRKSEPVYITVMAPTVETAIPTVSGVVYEDDFYIKGTAEGGSTVYIRRSDGTLLGSGKASLQEYGGQFGFYLEPRPIAGDTLYLTAKGYGKIISNPVPLVVKNRPVTPMPTVIGEVYSDYRQFQARVTSIPYLQVYLKDMNGITIADTYAFSNIATFYLYQTLKPDTQYQLTAIAPGMKESEPFIFTVKAPTVATPLP